MKIIGIILAVTFAGALALSTGAYGFIFGQVCVATGTITVYGHQAERGLPVTAYIGEEKVAQAQTQEGGRFELRIPEYDPQHPDVKGYRSADDVIQVKLDGKEAKPTFNPDKSSVVIDLEVEQSLDVKLSTWGKIKALFK